MEPVGMRKASMTKPRKTKASARPMMVEVRVSLTEDFGGWARVAGVVVGVALAVESVGIGQW
jgi:hypothetical protein